MQANGPGDLLGQALVEEAVVVQAGEVVRDDLRLEAGFANVEVLSIETDFWRFYRLVP